MRFSLEVNVGELGPMVGSPDDPRNGKLTFYFRVSFGKRHYYLARWDSERVEPKRLECRGKVMTTYAGRY